MTTREEE